MLESIYFYNFTTPEFNVNVSQLPFWSLVVYFSWKIYSSKEIKLIDCLLLGLFGKIELEKQKIEKKLSANESE